MERGKEGRMEGRRELAWDEMKVVKGRGNMQKEGRKGG